MIPLRDENPTRTTPFLTVGIVCANLLVFLYQLVADPTGEILAYSYGAIPYNMTHLVPVPGSSDLPVIATVFTSMFLHGGIWHVGGNMLYLWIFGNNVEDAMGHLRFLVFYFLCGVVAAYSHAIFAPSSLVPMIGASGAISGILGAYFLLFPQARILTLVPFGFFLEVVRLPAVVLLGGWVLVQFINGTITIGEGGGGVAWFAHVGGFAAGLSLCRFFVRSRRIRVRW